MRRAVPFLGFLVFAAWGGAAPAQLPQLPPFSSTPTPLDQTQDGIFAADLDGDGRLDLAVVGHSAAGIRVKLGDGAGGFGAGTLVVPTMTAPNFVKAADLTGDGRLDLLSYTWDDSGPIEKIAVHAALAAGGYSAPIYVGIPLVNGWLGDVQVGDVDLDGLPDLVATDRAPFAATVVWFRNLGNGAFGAPLFSPLLAGGALTSLAIADANRDGALDAYACGGSASANSVWELPGLGSVAGFGLPTTITMGPSAVRVAVGDLDGDGYPELVAARGATGGSQLTAAAISVRHGTPAGYGAGALVSFSLGFGILFADFRAMRIADVNGDGQSDVVYLYGANQFGAQLATNGGSGFTATTMPVTGTGLEIADFDADGDCDLLVSNDAATSAAFLANGAAAPPGFLAFGGGTPGCAGTLGIAANGAPSAGNGLFKVLATGAPKGALALLLLGNASDFTGSDPLGLGCALHVAPLASTLLLGFDAHADASGFAAAPVPIPNDPTLVGAMFAVQLLGVESGASGWRCGPSPFGLLSSRGALLTIQ